MSLTSRATLAIFLMVLFYALALGMAGIMIGIVLLQLASGHLYIKITLILIALAGIIVWSILPRWDSFVPPGPELTRDQYPELFRQIGELAEKCGHPVPRHIYLLHDANAWVAQRGGMMGLLSKPVMAIGLPLFKILTTDQLLAVIGHEFGHFVGGDTKLGPWIYKTRQAIGRTIGNLDSWIRQIFVAYMKMFLRITQAVSRQQEISADALAAKYTSKAAMSGALEKVSTDGVKYDTYFQAEVVPLLERGFLPDIDGGYKQALKNTKFVSNVETNLTTGEKSPYDSHPPLAERLAAIAALPDGESRSGTDTPALSLIPAEISSVEKTLFEFLLRRSLEKLEWENILESVYKPIWSEAVTNNGEWLNNADAAGLVAMAQDLEGTIPRINKNAKLAELGPEQIYFVLSIIGSALALRLLEAGYTAKVEIGSEWEFSKAGKTFNPFRVIQEASADKSLRFEF